MYILRIQNLILRTIIFPKQNTSRSYPQYSILGISIMSPTPEKGTKVPTWSLFNRSKGFCVKIQMQK